MNGHLGFLKIDLFIWLYQDLVVACCGKQTVSCSMWKLVPQQGMERRPPALEALSFSQYTTRDVPIWDSQPLAFVNNSARTLV